MIPDYTLSALKADILKALAHPTRISIVEILGKGERCVCELNAMFKADQSTISKHLSILKKAGIVSDRKAGVKVFYRLETPCIIDFINCIDLVIESRARKHLSHLKGRKI